MQQQIGEMKAEGVGIPEKVIGHEREVLHRPIMPGERVREEMVPEDLEREQRAFDEGAVAREKFVVPQEFAREGGCSNHDGDEQEKSARSQSERRTGANRRATVAAPRRMWALAADEGVFKLEPTLNFLAASRATHCLPPLWRWQVYESDASY